MYQVANDKTAGEKRLIKDGSKKASSSVVEKLRRRNKELIDLNRSKDEFVAIASHQLRTPATAVRQYIGLLLEGYAEPLTQNQLDFLRQAYESNERQLHILEELLRVTQLDLEKVPLAFKSYDIGKLAEAAVSAMRDEFKSRQQTVEFRKPRGGPIRAKVDYNQMIVAVQNLLENSSKYTPADKKIKVSVRRTVKWVKIIIQDEGVGIASEDFGKLFQKFSRIPNKLSIEAGGTGLGLYWAAKIVHLHDGFIGVSSQPDRGSSFVINLPKNGLISNKYKSR